MQNAGSGHAIKARNSEIDLLRLAFSLFIVLYHISLNIGSVLMQMGGMATDYFFLVRGMFLSQVNVTEKRRTPQIALKYVIP